MLVMASVKVLYQNDIASYTKGMDIVAFVEAELSSLAVSYFLKFGDPGGTKSTTL